MSNQGGAGGNSSEKRHSFGIKINDMGRRNTTIGGVGGGVGHLENRNLEHLASQENENDDIFEKSEFYMRRPESARVKIPSQRDNLFTSNNSNRGGDDQFKHN